MDWLLTTLAIYRKAFGRGLGLTLRNLPVVGTMFAYLLVMLAAYWLARRAGFIGGFAVPIGLALCSGSFLYCVEAIVRSGRANLADVRASAGAYFGDVISVMFALWIFSLVGALLQHSPLGPALIAFSAILIFVFFNAVPELIYLGRHSTMDLLGASYRFILQNWIEWMPVSLLFAIAYAALWNLPAGGEIALVARFIGNAVLLYFAMIVRGLLFLELIESSRRSRIFRHRAGGD